MVAPGTPLNQLPDQFYAWYSDYPVLMPHVIVLHEDTVCEDCCEMIEAGTTVVRYATVTQREKVAAAVEHLICFAAVTIVQVKEYANEDIMIALPLEEAHN